LNFGFKFAIDSIFDTAKFELGQVLRRAGHGQIKLIIQTYHPKIPPKFLQPT
jgi:hypothetical protein